LNDSIIEQRHISYSRQYFINEFTNELPSYVITFVYMIKITDATAEV